MKKLIVFIVLLFCISTTSYSMTISEEFVLSDDTTIYEEVDVLPEFEGGIEGLTAYLKENIVYPEEAIEKKETARIYLEFVVDKSGNIKNIVSLKKVEKYFEEEAIRVLSTMPKWKPAMLNGESVNSKVVLPITFQL